MRALRHLSARPTVIVDQHFNRIGDPATGTQVGMAGPFGRERVVFALPLNGSVNTNAQFQGPPPTVLVDNHGNYIAGPDDTLVGIKGVWVARMMAARWTEDTRRLAG